METNFDKIKLPKRAPIPFVNDYQPELDTAPVLNAAQVNHFQSQIGVLICKVELRRIDIMTKASLLSSHLAMPREGNIDAVYRIFGCLKHKHNSCVIFDPTYPLIEQAGFNFLIWGFYGGATAAIPPNAPKPLGKEVDLRLFCDFDHVGDGKTRRYRNGFFIFLNMAPIVWLSKKQPTIETRVFGTEFVAMIIVMETLFGVWYKLRVMDIPLSWPSYIYYDNVPVIHNT